VSSGGIRNIYYLVNISINGWVGKPKADSGKIDVDLCFWVKVTVTSEVSSNIERSAQEIN
jgi:hypothetical protein